MTSIRRVHGTADLIALVPHLAGMTCDDSLVLVPFSHGRTQGALRINRPTGLDPDAASRIAGHLVGMLCNLDDVDALFPLITTPAPLHDSGEDRLMLAAVVVRAQSAGFTVPDAALLAIDGWTSIEEPEAHPLPTTPTGLPAPADPARAAALPTADETAAAALEAQRHDAWLSAAAAFHAFDPTDAIETAIHAQHPDALLATVAAIPVLRDLCLLQAGWGQDFSRQVWRRTVLDHTPLDADEDAAVAYRGGNFRRPDPDRLRALIAALRATAAATSGAERTGIAAMLAWLQWAHGCSSIAAKHAADALIRDPGHGLASIVRGFIDTGTLPEWAYRAEPLP